LTSSCVMCPVGKDTRGLAHGSAHIEIATSMPLRCMHSATQSRVVTHGSCWPIVPSRLCRPLATRLLLHQRHSKAVVNQRVLQPCVILCRGFWGVPDRGRGLLCCGRPSWPVCQSNPLPIGVVLRDRRPILVSCWALWSSSRRNVTGVHGRLRARPLLPCGIHCPNTRALWNTHHVLPYGMCMRVVGRCFHYCSCLTGAFTHALRQSMSRAPTCA
jgi:hypothetical protein